MKRKLVKIVVGVLVAGGLFGLSRFFDFPAIPDRKSSGFEGLRFYSYGLGGFIDTQYLWRVDGDREAIESLMTRLKLQKTDAIPDEFWRVRPYYWPKKDFNGSEAYRSPSFSASSRGRDGRHFFAVYDPDKNRAYVWLKDNF